MNFIDNIISGQLDLAKEDVYSLLNVIAAKRLEEIKKYVSSDIYELEEAKRPSSNILKIGRVQKIRRRIRRNAKGRIIVQKNIKRSSIKGYRVSGNTIKRIPSAQRILKTRKLKRYWATKGRSKLSRTLLKRNDNVFRI